ncbi:MAG: glycosyltransferase [bacterium]
MPSQKIVAPCPPRVVIYCLDQDPTTTSSLGIYHYTRNLIHELARKPDPRFKVILLLCSTNAEDFRPSPLPSWMECRIVPGRFSTGVGRLWGDHLLGPHLIRATGASLVHFPKGYVPWGRLPCKIVATLHDTIASHYASHPPACLSRFKLRYFDWLTRHSLRRADRVLTDSRYSLAELEALVPGTAGKSEVVYIGPGVSAPQRVSGAMRSGVLVLGSRFPHKATAETLALLSAYALRGGWHEPVTVTGLRAWPDEWGACPVGADIRFVGRVPDAELVRLMGSSRALLLLSTLEGFGLPALESYAAGTPVCYRATTSLEEILEGIPGGWDGRGEATFAAALDAAMAMSPSDIAVVQADLAARFNWARAADDVMKIYREMLSSLH